jgi:hypothetical protein
METNRRQLTPVPRRGRPRQSPEPCTSISTWVPEPYHDRLILLANRHNMSVSSLVKRFIIIQLEKT